MTDDRCATVRTALSAHVDGEAADLAVAEVDTHVHGCAACTAFAAELSLLDERVAAFRRLPVEDRTAEVLSAAAAPATGPTTDQLRGLLALAAVVQVVIGVTALALGDGHLARDLAFFELASGGGLAAAAWRPSLAAGMLPMVALAALFGLVALVTDVATGTTSLAAETAHMVLLVATWPLVTLARREGPSGTVATS